MNPHPHLALMTLTFGGNTLLSTVSSIAELIPWSLGIVDKDVLLQNELGGFMLRGFGSYDSIIFFFLRNYNLDIPKNGRRNSILKMIIRTTEGQVLK